MKYLLIACLLWFTSATTLQAKDFVITDYGAIRGSTAEHASNNTRAIQQAINEATASGGGRVVVPSGVFITGTILLENNVTLYLSEGSTLAGSTRIKDYPIIYPTFKSYTDSHVNKSIIYAENKENIAIEGKGTIDGNGGHKVFVKGSKDNDAHRPFGIRIVSCRYVTVRGITLRNSAQWMQHYLNCEHLLINNIQVFNHVNLNNDGLDIDGCRNVIVSDCLIDADDDALCLKADGPADCNSIVITNCVLRSNCNAFKMGTETTGGFKNITASNLVIQAASEESPFWKRRMNLAGIVILSMDGGHTEDISISNVVIDSVYAPLFIKLGNRARLHRSDATKPAPGSIKNIRLSQITAHDTRMETSHISGFPEHDVENVIIENSTFYCYGGGQEEHIQAVVPEKETVYPDVHMYANWYPSYGLFARHVSGLTLNNVIFKYDRLDVRPAVFCEDVKDFVVFNVRNQAGPLTKQEYYLKNVKGALFRNSIRSEAGGKYIYAENSQNVQTFQIMGLKKKDVQNVVK